MFWKSVLFVVDKCTVIVHLWSSVLKGKIDYFFLDERQPGVCEKTKAVN
jgi:hypothetical protein